MANMTDWRTQAEAKLNKLFALPDNWDSYGARRIDPELGPWVMRFLKSVIVQEDIIVDERTVPSIVPTTDGGIQLEWHVPPIDIEIEFPHPGRIVMHAEVDAVKDPGAVRCLLMRVDSEIEAGR